MKEALKYLDTVSFDDEEEALSTVSVSDAQWAVKIGVIEELQRVYNSIENYSSIEIQVVKRNLLDRIKNLQSKQTKLNDPS
jgi:hypothetical protein